MLARLWPCVGRCHNRTVASPLPLARVLPSGLNATELTNPSGPVRGPPIGWRVATFHNTIVVSPKPVARVVLSGLNATDQTPPPWPVRRGAPIGWRVATFHNTTVLS